MQTILQILKQAGGWHHGLYLKIENPPYMALVIEATDESGPCGLPAISVCHYGEQNGDLMRDPEMCFELGFAAGAHLEPYYWRNDYAGIEQWSRFIRDGNYIFHTALFNEHERFARLWDTTCVSGASPKPSSGSSRRHAPKPVPAPERMRKRIRFTTSVQCNRSRRVVMQDSSAFQFLAIDTIHESTTNPRRTFDEAKLYELAESIKHNGLIQPITVRPNNQGFEIVAGARRYRAAQLAELFSVPARIVEIDDAKALEWQLVENSQRVDVHPYEEAQGFQRLLDIPGYDVSALVEKSGKSASHVYARLSLLQLIPTVAEAFTQERITASHANLIARLPQESQAEAFEQCWRKDWQDKEPHLLPAKHVTAWIQANLYLSLADAPFDREDPTLNSTAGACVTCPRRSGYNTALFADVVSDQCLDSNCYHSKVEAFLDREIAAHPGLVQIENGWRNPKEQRPGAVQRGHVREIESVIDNPDAEPVMPCEAAKPAIVVYGKQLGRKLTVCTDKQCPVHDPQAAAEAAAHPVPTMPPPQETETDEEAGEREAEFERQRAEYEEERQRREEERKQQFEREQAEIEAEHNRRAEIIKSRQATFDRILQNAPAILNAEQLRVLLRALVNLDPYTFADDLAEDITADNENEQRSAEEVLLSTIDATADDQLTRFALRLALAGHVGIPRKGEFDFLSEAETVFVTPQPTKRAAAKKAKQPTPVNSPAKRAPKAKPQRAPSNKKIAA